MERIAVLGSGMAGLGATHRLAQDGLRPAVYDRNSYYGGHTASFTHEGGFTFDIGPHISFTKDTRIRRMFEGVDLMKRLWSGDEVTFDGEFTKVTKAHLGMKTVQKPLSCSSIKKAGARQPSSTSMKLWFTCQVL